MGLSQTQASEVRSVPRCVLVVEDDPLLRRVVGRLLRVWEVNVIEASDGGIAVDQFDAVREQIDVILLDIMLPVLNGVEVARCVLERAPKQPIVACSAAFDEPTEETLRGLGVRFFLPKPFTADALRRALTDATCTSD